MRLYLDAAAASPLLSASSNTPILGLKTWDLREDLIAADDQMGQGQSRGRNPEVVVVKSDSLAFQ
jgi:hypothetical protein